MPQDGLIHIGLLHGDVTTSDSRYRPIRAADIAGSGLDYLALGHVHSCSDVLTAGAVPYAYCGCIEGRGFDELGERGFLFGEVGAGTADLRFVPFARRRYCIAQVDVTDGDALTALERTLPHDTEQDIYRLRLTGTPEQPPRLSLLEEALSGSAAAGRDYRAPGPVGQVRRGYAAGPVFAGVAPPIRRRPGRRCPPPY